MIWPRVVLRFTMDRFYRFEIKIVFISRRLIAVKSSVNHHGVSLREIFVDMFTKEPICNPKHVYRKNRNVIQRYWPDVRVDCK